MMGTKMQPRRVSRANGQTTYASNYARGVTPFARTAFAVWGLMSEIVGAACVVFGAFATALLLTGGALVMFF
jgi:hypothetical protein